MGRLPGISGGGSLKYRIWNFAIKYGRQVKLDRIKRAKSLEDRFFREGDSFTIDLARRDLEHEASERYKGFVVRTRLKRVSNEAVKCNAFEVRRFLHRYIEFVKSPDGHTLRLNREMHGAFRVPFRDHCSDLPGQEFCCYSADFSRLWKAETASCEDLVTECEVRDALMQVSFSKSLGLDGVLYEVYLKISHEFVPILTDMFNHFFVQWAIPGSITKCVITLLKKGSRHVWKDLD